MSRRASSVSRRKVVAPSASARRNVRSETPSVPATDRMDGAGSRASDRRISSRTRCASGRGARVASSLSACEHSQLQSAPFAPSGSTSSASRGSTTRSTGASNSISHPKKVRCASFTFGAGCWNPTFERRLVRELDTEGPIRRTEAPDLAGPILGAHLPADTVVEERTVADERLEARPRRRRCEDDESQQAEVVETRDGGEGDGQIARPERARGRRPELEHLCGRDARGSVPGERAGGERGAAASPVTKETRGVAHRDGRARGHAARRSTCRTAPGRRGSAVFSGSRARYGPFTASCTRARRDRRRARPGSVPSAVR